MRALIAILLVGSLLGCGLGYQDRGVERRPERATGVGATIIGPGQSGPAMPGPYGAPGSTQSSQSGQPGASQGSQSTSGSSGPSGGEMTLIGGHSGEVSDEVTTKQGPAFLPILGYPFWVFGKALGQKTDEVADEQRAAVQREQMPVTHTTVRTPDDVERARLQYENEALRAQLEQQEAGPGHASRPRSHSIAEELAALERSLQKPPVSSPAPPTTGPGATTAPRATRSRLSHTGLAAPEAVDRNADGRPDLWGYDENGYREREALDDDYDGRVDRVLYYDPQSRLIRSEEDLDGDGLMETVTHFQDGHIARKRTDSNGDGLSDAWSFYAAGELQRHEIDRSGDGFRDLVMSYEGGQLSREEEDRNADGRPDRVTIYKNGQLAETLDDADYDGVIDVESFYENGKLVRRNLNSDRALEDWHGGRS